MDASHTALELSVEVPIDGSVLYGSHVSVLGNIEALGRWQPRSAIRMSATAVPVTTADGQTVWGHRWASKPIRVEVDGMSAAVIEYKCVAISDTTGEVLRWEPIGDGKNRRLPIERLQSNYIMTMPDRWGTSATRPPIVSNSSHVD
mmetsp:Transcript_33805/g.97492  ORF Transcript_33805/g.97492 Transcript_33805/m.97492 type:complete len:146 (-) Transcript_33805:23-460(-)